MGLFWSKDIEPEEVNERVATEEIVPREHYTNSYQFVFTLIGYCISIGNFRSFPFDCYKYGRGTFIICYIVVSMIVALPYFFLELALGQYMQTGILGIWAICPLFKGVGWAMMMTSFYTIIYYIVILAWASLYLINSFQLELPWRDCGNSWNTIDCVPATCKGSACFQSTKNASSTREYWDWRILQRTEGIDHIGTMQWELVGLLFLMWILTYFFASMGIKWMARISYVTVVVPYLLLLILLVPVLFLDGGLDGILYYITPLPEIFLKAEVWYQAVVRALYSLGLGFGTLHAFGSYNDYHNNIYCQCFIIAAIDFLSCLFFGFVVFSNVGFLSKLQEMPIEEVLDCGSDLAFVIYPTIVLELQWSPVWVILLFLAIVMIGIDAQFCFFEGFMKTLQEEFPNRLFQGRKIVYLVAGFVFFILGLIYVTQGGIYAYELTEKFALVGWSIFGAVFCEGVAISYLYGVNNFYLVLEDMLGFRPMIWWKICWVLISPITIMTLVFGQLMTYETPTYKNYVFPKWAVKIGWLMSASSILCIPLYMIYYISTMEGTLRERLNNSVKPSYEISTPSLLIEHSEIESSKIENSQIENSKIENSEIENSEMEKVESPNDENL